MQKTHQPRNADMFSVRKYLLKNHHIQVHVYNMNILMQYYTKLNDIGYTYMIIVQEINQYCI